MTRSPATVLGRWSCRRSPAPDTRFGTPTAVARTTTSRAARRRSATRRAASSPIRNPVVAAKGTTSCQRLISCGLDSVQLVEGEEPPLYLIRSEWLDARGWAGGNKAFGHGVSEHLLENDETTCDCRRREVVGPCRPTTRRCRWRRSWPAPPVRTLARCGISRCSRRERGLSRLPAGFASSLTTRRPAGVCLLSGHPNRPSAVPAPSPVGPRQLRLAVSKFSECASTVAVIPTRFVGDGPARPHPATHTWRELTRAHAASRLRSRLRRRPRRCWGWWGSPFRGCDRFCLQPERHIIGSEAELSADADEADPVLPG